MARVRTSYLCSACGHQTVAFSGRCPQCSAWNTMEPAVAGPIASGPARLRVAAGIPAATLLPLTKVADDAGERLSSEIPELDRVLGGGIVAGSLLLVGGDPGIGKSTLMLQLAAKIAARGGTVAYVCGEESPRQVRLRASRLGISGDGISLIPETNLDAALAAAAGAAPDLLIVDSIQSVYVEGLDTRSGGPAQLAESGARLVNFAKSTEIATIVTGHVTKAGEIAGPRLLEHLVDTVLYFEGADAGAMRILRAVKNRFGAIDEVGVFEMTGEGLRSVDNPSAAFIDRSAAPASGCAVTAIIEGSRPLAIEVQALAVRSTLAAPRRIASGLETSRLHLLLAVLARRGNLDAAALDVVATVSGGLRLRDPGADLAILAALASAVRDQPLDHDTAFLGEVALSGAIRPVQQAQRRVSELARLGFRRVIMPPLRAPLEGVEPGIALVPVRSVAEALAAVL